MKRIEAFSSSSELAIGPAVELDAAGVPTAFRIWCAGDNPTDYGVHRFTEASARLLLAEQTVRGNKYSIDVDHMSVKADSLPEQRRAVGYHELEVRNGELWATNVEWTPEVRAELAKRPPGFRFISPAYNVDQESGEIVRYLNTALTINPATWRATELASAKEPIMTPEEIRQELASIAAAGSKRAAEVLAAFDGAPVHATRLPPHEKAALDREMGIGNDVLTHRVEGCILRLGVPASAPQHAPYGEAQKAAMAIEMGAVELEIAHELRGNVLQLATVRQKIGTFGARGKNR
jgi:hypothetical protein